MELELEAHFLLPLPYCCISKPAAASPFVPAFLELLSQEPGKPVMLVFALSDPAEIMSDQCLSCSGKEGTVSVT